MANGTRWLQSVKHKITNEQKKKKKKGERNIMQSQNRCTIERHFHRKHIWKKMHDVSLHEKASHSTRNCLLSSLRNNLIWRYITPLNVWLHNGVKGSFLFLTYLGRSQLCIKYTMHQVWMTHDHWGNYSFQGGSVAHLGDWGAFL